MKILFLGDVMGQTGCEAVKRSLPELQSTHAPDLVIANIENAAEGFGVVRSIVENLLRAGVDAFTTGNHVFDQPGYEDVFAAPILPIVRPLNWPGKVAGQGSTIIEKDGKRTLLMNILGRVFVHPSGSDPFTAIERVLQKHAHDHLDAIVLDVHAETTSEKRAIAEVFDGKIHLIIGTHTHVQTADAQTLPKGTGFITDLGMCGPNQSVIGFDTATTLRKFRTSLPMAVPVAEGPCDIHGCMATIENGRTRMETIKVSNVQSDVSGDTRSPLRSHAHGRAAPETARDTVHEEASSRSVR